MTLSFVHITDGYTNAGARIKNATCQLIEGIRSDSSGMYITVGGGSIGLRNGRNRVYIESEDCISAVDGKGVAKQAVRDSDETIALKLHETFQIVEDMTNAVAAGTVKGLIISGPPGVGKSYTVEDTLSKNIGIIGSFRGEQMYELVSGSTTPAALYEILWNYRQPGQVLVFDDCDSVFYDVDSLNMIKAALDTKKHRYISYNARSTYLEKNDIPNRFEFQGSIIFITNLKFDQVRSPKLVDHLAAMASRCHYMDLGINTEREKLIHLKNVVQRSNMLAAYNFTPKEKAEVVDFINQHANKLRELSLRMCLKVADLRKSMPHKWERTARATCFK